MVIICTVEVTHGQVGTMVITVTFPQFDRDFFNKSHFMVTPQYRKLTYVV